MVVLPKGTSLYIRKKTRQAQADNPEAQGQAADRGVLLWFLILETGSSLREVTEAVTGVEGILNGLFNLTQTFLCLRMSQH